MLEFQTLGCVPYEEAERIQRKTWEERVADRISDRILFLEHPAVYTVGKQDVSGDWRRDEVWRRQAGIHLAKTDRGGRVTYHGPGQLVGYCILKLRGRLKSVPTLVSELQTALVDTLASWGLAAEGDARYPGVWVRNESGLEKIAAIGLAISRGVTRHGFALNVSPNLDHYAGIVPCGIPDRSVTSMQARLGASTPSLEAVQEALKKQLRLHVSS